VTIGFTTLQNQGEFMLNFNSELIDIWTKSYSKKLLKYSKVYFIKSKKTIKKIRAHNWRQEVAQVGDSFYINLAVRNGASQEIPYSTLILIGKNLQNNKYKEITKSIINKNLLSTGGFVFQLDDLESQSKIRKAFRTKSFSLAQNTDAA
jgi:hypothetical protein